MFRLKRILEVLYSVGNLEKVKHFFCDYGGWNQVGTFLSQDTMLDFWQLESSTQAKECLIQSDFHPTGQLRLVKFENVSQRYIRSSQQPWDTGGIMDINLRVHEVENTFEELRELGWHGLSDPLLQTMDPFQLYDILMKGFDDTIIAFTHRLKPPLTLPSPIKLPTHVYNSSLVVKSLKESKAFFVDQLGCKLLDAYEVKKQEPQENMFGLPFNLANQVTCKANIFSFDGERDTFFQVIEFQGVSGKDFSKEARPPNRGFMTYRVEVENIQCYYDFLLQKEVQIFQSLRKITIEPYGRVFAFAVLSPDGVWITFLEKDSKT